MKLNTTRLSRICKEFSRKHKETVKDIILFGSSVRGKETPADVDILLLFCSKVDKDEEYMLRKMLLPTAPNITIISKTVDSVLEPSFDAKESILFEGYSLVNQRFVSKDYGFQGFGLFIYQTKKLSNTMKTQFYYALKGRRGAKGTADELNLISISNNILAVPLESIDKAKDFFEQWDIEYTYVPALIPERLAKRHILDIVR